MEHLLDVSSSQNQLLKLESTLFDFNINISQQPAAQTVSDAQRHEPVPSAPPLPNATGPKASHEPIVHKKAAQKFTWQAALQRIKTQNASLYAILRQAEASVNHEAATVSLKFPFAFHQKRVEDQKNKQVVLDALRDLAGVNIAIRTTLGIAPKRSEPASVKLPNPQKDKSDTIIELMGGGEEYNGQL
jgi:hypothetical protein